MKIEKTNYFFSIILCCYNSQAHITETIQSILNQDFNNWELIIIDDGSKDKTKEIINKIIKDKKNINYYYKENSGYANSRNFGISKSKGEWIAFIDHDDLCSVNRLNSQYKDIQNNPQCELFFSDAYLLNYNKKTKFEIYNKISELRLKNKVIQKNHAVNMLLKYGCFIPSSSVVIKKTIFTKLKLNESFKIIADYDFYCRLALFTNFYSSSEILVSWRNNEYSISSLKYKDQLKETLIMHTNYIKDEKFSLYKFTLIKFIIINFLKLYLKI